jgi:hypothetical protein
MQADRGKRLMLSQIATVFSRGPFVWFSRPLMMGALFSARRGNATKSDRGLCHVYRLRVGIVVALDDQTVEQATISKKTEDGLRTTIIVNI